MEFNELLNSADVAAQLRLEEDYVTTGAEAALIAAYCDAAMDAVRRYVHCPADESLIDFAAEQGGTVHVFRVAALLLAGHWYRLREAVTGLGQSAVPFGVEFLLRPYVKLVRG